MTESADLCVEEIECVSCKLKGQATVAYADGRGWYLVPPGWFAADTYPPGDMGLIFACSVLCASSFLDPL